MEGGYAVPPSERPRAATQKAYEEGTAPVEVWAKELLAAIGKGDFEAGDGRKSCIASYLPR
jgi:hypothetical protein